MAFRRILVAVDEGPIAAHAVDLGISLARAVGAELGFVTVVDPREELAVEAGVAPPHLVAMAKHEATQFLAGLRERAAGIPVCDFVAVGTPFEEIVKAAKEWPADLVVIGSHGRRGIGRLLLGSVAEAVMRHAPCSVLVVRAPE